MRALLLLVLLASPLVQAQPQTSEQALDAVAFDQKIGARLPGDLAFQNQRGEPVDVAALAEDTPVLMVLAWYECPNLCPMLLDQLAKAVKRLPFDSEEYQVVVASIDPQETPAEALNVERRLREKYGDVVNSWQLLTGDAQSIDALTEAVGFEYAYDPERDSYAHPAGVVVLEPGAVVNRYLFGLKTNAPDLKLALVQAGQGNLGSPVDQVVLRCYRFSPDSGQYNLAVLRLVKIVGSLFVLGMAGLIFVLWRRERK
ncbi:SCO family protein [Marinobacteraceae bacterium S3BR75-40.1]